MIPKVQHRTVNQLSLNNLVNRYGMSVSQHDQGYVPFVVSTIPFFPNS